MKITVAETAGFCYGVSRAVKMALEAAQGTVPCVMLGPVIHNQSVIDHLRRAGVEMVQQVGEIPEESMVILRSHGEGQEVYQALKARGAHVVDTTCPFVSRIHRLVREAQEEGRRVVIDAGHGGDDPGKVGINGANEKDVNLEIARLVKQYLEMSDVEVVMTRESDEGLNDADASNKKVQDMKRRIALIEETAPALTVSIHQNSYPEEYVHGAQVFYYTGSVQGQRLAEHIQGQLVERVDPENKRQVKANDSYYLLKKTGVPIVIVECGFLSNSAEAEKLCTPEYQQRVAWAIHMGILEYLNENEK